MSKTITLDYEIRAILERSTFTVDSVTLQKDLPRPLYVRVNKVLELAGGCWNRKRAAHIFGEDPARVLGLAVATGTLDPSAVDITKLSATAKLANFVDDLFPTPVALVRRMVDLAGIAPGHAVLEPSAGTGNLVRAIADACTGFDCVKVCAVECNHALVAGLIEQRDKTVYANERNFKIVCGEFLEQSVSQLGHFDRVLMNPPFANASDIKHILHALTFLKPNGRLVAICLNGSRQQAALRMLVTESSGTWEELPVGTFKDAGTNVSTVLLSINV